jgi:ribosomal protein S27E
MFDEHMNRQHRLAYFVRGPEWAFAIPQGDLLALDDVTRRCSTFWNGVGSLLVPVREDGQISRWVEKLLRIRPVDACFLHERLSNGARAAAQRRIPGAVPLWDGFAAREVRPLDLPPPARPGRPPEVMLELPRFRSQALRRATLAIWGHIPDESFPDWEESYNVIERDGEAAYGALLRSQIEGQSVSPLRLSAGQMGGVWQESPLDRPYLFVLSGASFNTLVTFWNLRARSLAPANGLPVIGVPRETLRRPEELGALSAWLGPRTLWRVANEFFVVCKQGLHGEVRDALARVGFVETPEEDPESDNEETPARMAPTYRFASPWLGGRFIRGAYANALVAVAGGRSSLALPAPEGFTVRGLGHTRLVLHNLPLPLPLTPSAARRVHRDGTTADGVMLLTNAAQEWNFDIRLPTAAESLTDWIADHGCGLNRTQDGRDAEALLRRLGSLGALDVLADRKRLTLLQVLAPQSRKKLAQRLVAEAKRAGTRLDEAEMLERLTDLGLFLEVQSRTANEIASQMKGKKTRQEVFELLVPLVAAGFLRRAASVRCPQCRFRTLLDLHEQAERVHCRACGETFVMPVTDNSGEAEPESYYRLDGLMARALDQDVLPVLLTMRAVRPPVDHPTLFFAWPGVEVTTGMAKPVDVDLLVSDGQNVWCFEVKQNASGLKETQFRKLLQVASKLNARPSIAAVEGAFPPTFAERVVEGGGRVLVGQDLLG